MNISHLLKSTLLISLAGIILNIGRLGLADNLSYLWLNWNLFLALVPILFAWLFIQTNNTYIRLLSFVLWLGFLPNAPYIITDFIHMADVGPKSIIWYDGMMIFLYTVAGMMSWVGSAYMIQKKAKWNQWFVLVIGLLSGFGVYLGRYIRFNTWDIITDPWSLLQTLADIVIHPQDHQPMALMTLVIAFMFIIFFTLVHHYEKSKN